jgi:Flp pilus assembly protein TadG
MTTTTARPRRRTRRDDGKITLLVLVFMVAILAVIGLSVDGGAKIRALQRANNIAADAARTAGQAIDATQAIPGGAKIVDPNAAVAAASAYLAAAGVEGTVGVSQDRQQVTVTVTITTNTVMLSIIGIDRTTVTGHATAQLIVV